MLMAKLQMVNGSRLQQKISLLLQAMEHLRATELVLPDNPTVEKLTIKAILKSDPKLWKEITIWIKKKPDDELLPTSDEILKNKSQKNGKSKRDN